MKRLLWAPIIVLMSFFCISCTLLTTGFIQHESNAWHICAAYAVPFMFNGDIKGNVAREVERDEYGRVLFTYTACSSLTGNYEEVAVICQKHDANYVYYYEDVCYTSPKYCDEEMEDLKVTNDWNEPLNEGKMTKRPYRTTIDGVIHIEHILEYSKVRDACAKAAMVEDEVLSDCVIDDVNYQSQQEMYYVQVTDANNEDKAYLAIIDAEYNVYLLLIENDVVSRNQIADFKEKNGWMYKASESQ